MRFAGWTLRIVARAVLLVSGFLVLATLLTTGGALGITGGLAAGFAGVILGVGLLFGARALIRHAANRESDGL